MTTSSGITDTGDETPSHQVIEYDWPFFGNRGEIPLGLTEAERPIFGGFDAATMVLTVNVFADVNSRDPTNLDPDVPVECDGTADGTTESQSDGTPVYFEDKFAEANNMLSMYWTGWWPTLHFVIQREFIPDVVLSIHVTLDILGNVGIETFNVEFLGVQDMTEPEADNLIDSIRPCSESMVGKGAAFSYTLGIGGILYTVARVISVYAPPGSAHAELAFWITLLLATAVIMAGLILLAQAVAQGQTDPLLAAVTFLGTAFTALGFIAATKHAVDKMGGESTGAAKYFRFFQERYQNGNEWQKVGLTGRVHWGMMFMQVLILATVVVIAVGFILGWVYDAFS